MATNNLTSFTGGGDVIATGTNEGRQFITKLVTVDEHADIVAVNTASVPDTTDPDYDPNFDITLYYIIPN